MERAVCLLRDWCKTQGPPGLRVEILRRAGATPLLLAEFPGTRPGAPALIYGHLDKQPELEGWRPDLGPWQAVLQGDRLYGRGSADDGYALFCAVLAAWLLHREGRAHPRLLILIEASEESGSPDLPGYLETLRERLERPGLVVCLDSSCGDYAHLWRTVSLRGLVGGILHIAVLKEGVHSGDAGGVVPGCQQVLRILLDRLEEAATGKIRPAAFQAKIPPPLLREARRTAPLIDWRQRFPFLPGVRPLHSDPLETLLNRGWRAALAVTGCAGLPALRDAGNAGLPELAVKLSLRLPPTCDAGNAARQLRSLLESDPPYGAQVRFETDWCAPGWCAPPAPAWLEHATEQSSIRYFGAPSPALVEGVTIPFMRLLSDSYPDTPFLVTGVLGPGSNAHGPNEFLHMPTAQRLACCLAEVLAAQPADPPTGKVT